MLHFPCSHAEFWSSGRRVQQKYFKYFSPGICQWPLIAARWPRNFERGGATQRTRQQNTRTTPYTALSQEPAWIQQTWKTQETSARGKAEEQEVAHLRSRSFHYQIFFPYWWMSYNKLSSLSPKTDGANTRGQTDAQRQLIQTHLLTPSPDACAQRGSWWSKDRGFVVCCDSGHASCPAHHRCHSLVLDQHLPRHLPCYSMARNLPWQSKSEEEKKGFMEASSCHQLLTWNTIFEIESKELETSINPFFGTNI